VPSESSIILSDLFINRLVIWIWTCLLLSFPAAAIARTRPATAPTATAQGSAQAPTVSPAAKATFTLGKVGSYSVKATGQPAPTLSQSGLPSDLGLTFDPTTGKLTGSAKKVGTYTITFQATNTVGTASQVLTLTVQAAASTKSSSPCDDSGTYTIQLRALQGEDADGVAKALNGSFDGFSVVAVPPSASNSKGTQTQSTAGASGLNQSQQNSAAPHQVLCVYLRNTDLKTGKLKAFVPKLPVSAEQSDLDRIVLQLDRPEFAGIGLDSRFLVHFAKINPVSFLVTALPAPAPGFELSSEDAIGQYLILHPAITDLLLATKATGDLSTQAGKLKRDLLTIDIQSGMAISEGLDPLALGGLVSNISNRRTLLIAEKKLEQWDSAHTVYLAVLDPRDVALCLAALFPNRDVQVLAQQRAIALRPVSLEPGFHSPGLQQGALVASDAIARAAVYEQSEANQVWEQKLQSDAASNAKQGNSNSNSGQPPATTTTSNTTISTPTAIAAAPATGSAAVNKTALQVQTTTSTQTTMPSGGQTGSTPGNSSPSSPSSSTPTGNGLSGGGSNSGTNAGAAANSGSNANQGAGASSGNPSSAGGNSQPTPRLSAGKVVRLYHLRQASNIATVLNAIVPGNPAPPLVQALSDNGNDDLLLILPPTAGQQDNTESVRRMIANLDEPRPTISLQVWSYEISSKKGTKPADHSGRIDQAQDVSDVYRTFIRAVQDTDNYIQDAMARGVAAAMNYAVRTEHANAGSFYDPTFRSYLTDKFEECIQSDWYCLGYEDALTFGPSIGTQTKVSLERFVVLLAAARDEKAAEMIGDAIVHMQDSNCQPHNTDEKLLCFYNLQPTLEMLAQRRNLHQFRAALLDFLFQYKSSTAYPNDFAPYYLQQSAQNLDGFLNDLITALDRDLDRYIEGRLNHEATLATRSVGAGVGLANFGEVQVNSISGDAANVSGTVNNYFDITQPALLKDVVSGLLSSAGGSGGGGAASNGGSGGTPSAGSGTGPGTSSGTGGSTTAGGGTGSAGAAGALASAAKLLTPWQAVALNALATASAPPQLMAQVNAQTTVAVTPISLDTASAAELNISIQVSNPTSTIDASNGSPSSFIRRDLANSVANFNVQTKVRVDSLKLFQISSLSMDLTHAETSVPVPVVGWVYEAIFGTVPWMKDHILAVPRDPKTILNRSVAVIRAVVMPTAMDLGLSMPFSDDDLHDPVTESKKSLSSLAQTSNTFLQFHRKLMHCILEDLNDCTTEVRLSQIPEQMY
jgi:hypothetical protein